MTAETDVLRILWIVLHWALWNSFAITVNFIWASGCFLVPACRKRLTFYPEVVCYLLYVSIQWFLKTNKNSEFLLHFINYPEIFIKFMNSQSFFL